MKHTLLLLLPLQRQQFERKKKTNSGNEYEQHVTIKIDNNVNKLSFLMPRTLNSQHT